MNIPTKWICPNCKTVNVTLVDSDRPGSANIETCDTEIGGCDERFVVETMRTIEVSAIYSLRMESA